MSTTGRQQPQLPQPRVIIPYDVYLRLRAYVINCPTEINGFGNVSVHGRNIWITDVFITEQIATMGSVEAPPRALNDLVVDLMAENRDIGRIKCQWHSHVNGPAYCSTVDTDAIDDWVGDWLVSMVLNKQGDIYCRLDYFRAPRLGVEIKPEIWHDLPDTLMADTAAEIFQKVRKPPTKFRAGKPLTAGKPASQNGFVATPDQVTTIAIPQEETR